MSLAISADVRAIFFDAVGTLIHPRPPATAVYAEVGRRNGSRLDEATIALRFREAFQREEEYDRAVGWRTNEAREIERWRRIVTTVLDDVDSPESCFHELFAHFGRPEAWRLDEAAYMVMWTRAWYGFLFGIASNFDHRLHNVLLGRQELIFVSHVLVSAEIGWRKPAPEFFAAVCDRTGLRPHEVLFVGNDLQNDYLGARAAGLPALLLDPHDKLVWHPKTRIRNLEELMG